MTINIVCRKDAINRNRLAPLALVFTHDRRRKFVGLGISVALEHWDFEKQQPTADCPDGAEIRFQITSKIREYEKKIKKLEVLEIPVTFDTLFANESTAPLEIISSKSSTDWKRSKSMVQPASTR